MHPVKQLAVPDAFADALKLERPSRSNIEPSFKTVLFVGGMAVLRSVCVHPETSPAYSSCQVKSGASGVGRREPVVFLSLFL